jgi:hypothetical protein
VAVAAGATGAVRAEDSVPCRVLEVRLSAPLAGSVVPARPLFLVTARVEGDCDGLAPAIQISHDGWKSIDRTWSQKESPLGWRVEPSDTEVAIAFRPPEGLDEELWQWRARVMAGGVLSESPRASGFRVDVTPPAEIEGLHLQRRPDGAVLLRWDPVALDVEGRPDLVDHYVIYRYDRRGTFPQGPLVRIGESRAPTWIDRKPAAGGQGISEVPPPSKGGAQGQDPSRRGKRASEPPAATIYYKVVAVDVAGNELGIREGKR